MGRTNWFLHGKTCQDHLAIVTMLLDTQKCQRKSTFASFIDFPKA